MSSRAYITRESESSLWPDLKAFESDMTRAFADVRITNRDATSESHAIEWERGNPHTSGWLVGNVRQDALAIALRGDDAPLYETALWVQARVGDAVLFWDWQGIPFALSRLPTVEAVIAAVARNDESLDYRRSPRVGSDE